MAKKWYVIHTYSGYETNVRDALQQRARQCNLEDKFGEILVPSETVTEQRPGGKTRVRQKLTQADEGNRLTSGMRDFRCANTRHSTLRYPRD